MKFIKLEYTNFGTNRFVFVNLSLIKYYESESLVLHVGTETYVLTEDSKKYLDSTLEGLL